jgi:alkaline phosphatase
VGQNLIKEALAKGYAVVRTRSEFDALMAQIKQRADFAPKVLGLFARDDIFNDVPEERLLATTPPLVDPALAGTKDGRLVLWGSLPGTPGHNPPTVAEMTAMALTILERRAAVAGKPFLLVAETESVDNFGNANNAIGALQALKRADDAIGAAQAFQQRRPETLILLAADSDGGAMQVIDSTNFLTSEPLPAVTTTNANPTGESAANVNNPLDGIEGRGTAPFMTAADAFGATRPIAISWPGTADYAGAIVARAQGLNAGTLRTAFPQGFDNTDVYRLMYLTLFGKALPSPAGKTAPSR